jgi:hypothetical protein
VTTVALTGRRPLVERPFLATLLLIFGAVITAAATLAGNGNPLFGVLPIGAAAAIYAFYVLPIRYPLYLVIFLSLALDAVDEGPWDSPLSRVGSLLAHNLNQSVPIGPLVLPGVAFILAAMVALLIHRSFVDSRTDSQGRTPTPLPLFAGLAVSFLTVMALVGIGAIRGGDVQMAKIQVQSYVLLLVMTYVCTMSLRGVQDYRILGRVVVGAAIVKSLYILFVVLVVRPTVPEGGELHAAATHGDSLLLAIGAVLVIVRFLENPSRRALLWCAGIVPLLVVAMELNNRRLVWVQLAAGLLTFAVLSRRSRMKRILANLLLLSLPLIIVYIVAGWNSQAAIFAPIQTYRSVTDGTVNASTLYRDLENFNLMMTMRLHPVTGMGFGQPFHEVVVLPTIAGYFAQYRYMPHNAILGLWAYTGPLGFTGLSMVLVIGVFFGIRSYRMAESADERIPALGAIAMVVIYLAMCWGDMGFSERRAIFLVGPALAIAGQLAYRTGAYRSRGHHAKFQEAWK